MRAFSVIREAPLYRSDGFQKGLAAAGYSPAGRPREPCQPGEILLIWNRYSMTERLALEFRARKGIVIVAENGLMGRDRADGSWYSLALDFPAAGGGVLPAPIPGEDRSQVFKSEYGEWRRGGKEVIVLEQRGIGAPGIASPVGWTEKTYTRVTAQTRMPVRIRRHPGEGGCVPLEIDLQHAAAVVTWGSGAALRALAMGIPVFYCLRSWIGAPASKQWTGMVGEFDNPRTDEQARARVFQAVGRSTWRIDEIEAGAPLLRLARASPFFRSETTPEAG